MKLEKGIFAIAVRSLIQIVRRPIYWFGFFGIPLFMFLFITSMMESGLPHHIPAAMVDRDGTSLSREVTQSLSALQTVDIKQTLNSFTDARESLQKGEIYGFFLIPENFQADLLAGREPVITFYTNMTYFVPGSILFKSFKTIAVYTKAGVAMKIANSAGADAEALAPMLQPVNIQSRGIGNPTLNYGIYLSNSFVPCLLQLMIMLMTVFSLGQEIKYGTSARLLKMADGSIVKAIFAKLAPQTLIWWIIAGFMLAWLYKFNGYTMQGSWWVMALSEMMFVLAAQGFALFIFGVLPNLRLSLSVCSLLGILSFSLAAFSFPVQSMYGAIGIFSYILPIRYNFLIYADQALNGIGIYYSRVWFAAYVAFIMAPFAMLWKIKKYMKDPVYAP
ncbi:MAG: ABC transporter permease [Muribaculaceae bacterium]|nr:ABC transporter permease [Muribaculaceae bacterium]